MEELLNDNLLNQEVFCGPLILFNYNSMPFLGFPIIVTNINSYKIDFEGKLIRFEEKAKLQIQGFFEDNKIGVIEQMKICLNSVYNNFKLSFINYKNDLSLSFVDIEIYNSENKLLLEDFWKSKEKRILIQGIAGIGLNNNFFFKLN